LYSASLWDAASGLGSYSYSSSRPPTGRFLNLETTEGTKWETAPTTCAFKLIDHPSGQRGGLGRSDNVNAFIQQLKLLLPSTTEISSRSVEGRAERRPLSFDFTWLARSASTAFFWLCGRPSAKSFGKHFVLSRPRADHHHHPSKLCRRANQPGVSCQPNALLCQTSTVLIIPHQFRKLKSQVLPAIDTCSPHFAIMKCSNLILN
jgi:hypothetical protein